MKNFLRRFRVVVIALAATVIAMLTSRALWPLDGQIYDIGITSRAPKVPQDIVILGIDEAFMQGRHAYLAPRDKLAKLIDTVSAARPSVIVLDVWLDSLIDKRQDALLRAALLQAKKRNVPVFLTDVGLENDKSLTGVTAHGSVLRYFADAAAGTGSAVFQPDRDQITRNIPPFEGTPLPLLADLAMRDHKLQRKLSLESWSVPYGVPIDWRGKPGTIGTTSAQKYLDQPFLAAMLADKAVFIGATYERSYDLLNTPYDAVAKTPRMYGVEVLANATATFNHLTRLSHETPRAYLALALAVFCLALGVVALALRGALPGVAGALVAVIGSGILAFQSAREPISWLGSHFWPTSPFLISAVFACGVGVALRQWEQAAELRLVRDAFGAYVGDEVLQKLGGKMPELGGEMRNIAVLFCDIRGYSALAESMQNDPARLMSELNAHFEPLVGALKKRGAYADNYVGDLVMALFGAPISAGTFRADSEASVYAALDFVRLVEERNTLRREKGEPPIEVGIGLHCGEAVVGNLGTLGPQSKIHYTAIGDAVNIASRVESTTRKYDVPLLVTEEIVQATGDTFKWEFVDETVVKGRVAPVRLYKNV